MPNIKQPTYSALPVPLQNAAVAWYGWVTYRRRFGPDFERMSAYLEESEWFEPERLRQYQEERLAGIVRHAYDTVAYYREVMDDAGLTPDDVRSLEDLPRIPILPRRALAEGHDRLLSTAYRRRALQQVMTSGTVGTPVKISWDRAVDVANNACTWRIRRWGGVAPGHRAATLLGRPIVPATQERPPFWRYNRSWNTLMFSCHHLRPDNLRHYVAKIREFEPESFEAYPSSAYILARFLEAEGEHLPVKALFLNGEPLLPVERGIIEDRFCVRAFDSYGLAERVAYTSECERHDGHHIFTEYGIVEILNSHGNPAEPGEVGHVVATSLHNLGMPLIRYDTGDTAVPRAARCECGRGLPMIEGVTTRAEDIIVLPDGRMVPPVIAQRGFWTIGGGVRGQVVQHTPDEIIARPEIDRPITPEEKAGLIEYFTDRFGPEVKIVVEPVERIPLTDRGKFRRIVSTVPLNLGAGDVANRYADMPIDGTEDPEPMD